jgi:hypothetical protein
VQSKLPQKEIKEEAVEESAIGMEGLFGDEPTFVPQAGSQHAGIKQPL